MHIWDYNIKDNWKPKNDSQWEWFLVRKINYGDIIGLKKEMIKKYFPKIKKLLDPGKREMFANFLNNHDKKTLKPRTLLMGVFIDSLDDIAANKTMAYFDRNEPKDLFDIYFLIHKRGFSPKKLLELVQQKFGLSFDEPLFWSEAFKSFSLLYELKPLLFEKDNIQEKLLKTIEDYFRNGSAEYLRQNLE